MAITKSGLMKWCVSNFIHLVNKQSLFGYAYAHFQPNFAIPSMFFEGMKKNWQIKTILENPK